MRSATVLAFAVALLLAPSWLFDARAASLEGRCNKKLATATAKLFSAQAKSNAQCVGGGNYDSECRRTAAVEKLEARVRKAVASERSACRAAVETDGVPLSSFGPTACPNERAGCERLVPSIDSLEDLADCLICTQLGRFASFRFDVGLPVEGATRTEDQNCMRKVYRMLTKAVAAGDKSVAKCGGAGAKPFSCPPDNAPGSALADALLKVDAAIDQCELPAGQAGPLSDLVATLCRTTLADAAELKQCASGLARCAVCRYANVAYDQSVDCPAFSGRADCDAGSFPDRILYALTLRDGDGPYRIVYLDPTSGRYLYGSYDASSIEIDTQSVGAIAVNPDANRLYASRLADDSVVFMYADRPEFIAGTIDASSFSVVAPHGAPRDLAVNPAANTLYVSLSGEDEITFLDATTGAPKFGILEASTFPTNPNPGCCRNFGLGVNAAADLVYVGFERNPQEGVPSRVVYLDGSTGAPAFGTLEDSAFAVAGTPYELVLNPTEDILYVSDDNFTSDFGTTHWLDASDGTFIGTFGPGTQIALDPATGVLWGRHLGTAGSSGTRYQEVEKRDASTGASLGALPFTLFPANGFLRNYEIAVDPVSSIVFASRIASETGPYTLVLLDAVTDELVYGDLSNSQVDLKGPPSLNGQALIVSP